MWREAFQSGSRSLKAIAIPGTTDSTEEATNATEGTALVAKVGVAATIADRPNGTTTCTDMGDARLTCTTSGTISLERNDVRRNRQVIPEGNAPDAKKVCTFACITERCCILAANVCTGMEINKCMQTKRGAIRKSTVRTKPTTSSADRTTLPRGEWTRGADEFAPHNRQ